MLLTDQILEFLTTRGLDCTTGKTGGHQVIYTDGNHTVIPLEINASSMYEASRQAERLQETIGLITKETGKYPLIITEDRWKKVRFMMQSRLLAHLRIFTQIYARNCEVRKIDKPTAAEFLSANHSYGDAKCRYRYGLYLKRHTGHNAESAEIESGTLVAVATFSNARKWIKADKTIRSYEWTRYASLPGVRLSGGMGKLLNAFIEDVKPDDIMTYADLEWSEGKVYEKLGFALEEVKKPVVFLIDSSWERFPVKPARSGNLFFQNLGSNKYRLKLTDYL